MNHSSIQQDFLDRLQRVEEFGNNQASENNESDPALLIENYQPRVRVTFNLSWYLPKDHLAIDSYRKVITIPANQIPNYTDPIPGQEFPVVDSNYVHQSGYTSLLPVLIPIQAARVDFREYDIVSERSSLRKIGMDKDEYIIGVMCHGRTLLLRRYENQPVDRNGIGLLFEHMCTPGFDANVEYQHLIEGQIGTLRTLITCEIDAVLTENGSIELKCREHELNPTIILDVWFQMFLSGTDTLKVGYRSKNKPIQLERVSTHSVQQLLDQQHDNGIRILQHLHQVLRFLQNHVKENLRYVLRRHKINGEVRIVLYEIVNKNDKQHLEFMPIWLLNQLLVNNN